MCRVNLNILRRMHLLRMMFIITMIGLWSCENALEVEAPPTSLTSDNVYADDATAAAVLTGIYSSLSSPSPLRGIDIGGMSLTTGLSSDELTLHGGTSNLSAILVQHYTNNLTSGASENSSTLWSDFYKKLYIVNVALERLQNAVNLTPEVRQQLIGEAKFLRAFFHFYLVNLYGDVPLMTTSDYRVNSVIARSGSSLVYDQIIQDLQEAIELLSSNYVAANVQSQSTERVRPNKWVAMALFARVYLYTQNWEQAKFYADQVISQSGLYSLLPLNEVFLKNSKEAIWQLQPVNAGWNTEDARVFIISSSGPTSNSTVTGNPVYLSQSLLNGFEQNDARLIEWISSITLNNNTYYYPFKYKSATVNAPVTEYTTVFRLSEMHLIRAEANARLGNLPMALTDINAIRNRAGLDGINNITNIDDIVLDSRRHELFTEWGHRWFDLKRMGHIDAVMSLEAAIKEVNWSTTDALYPLPLYDLIQNPNLNQNTGY